MEPLNNPNQNTGTKGKGLIFTQKKKKKKKKERRRRRRKKKRKKIIRRKKERSSWRDCWLKGQNSKGQQYKNNIYII
jgi:hypothetical protein